MLPILLEDEELPMADLHGRDKSISTCDEKKESGLQNLHTNCKRKTQLSVGEIFIEYYSMFLLKERLDELSSGAFHMVPHVRDCRPVDEKCAQLRMTMVK